MKRLKESGYVQEEALREELECGKHKLKLLEVVREVQDVYMIKGEHRNKQGRASRQHKEERRVEKEKTARTHASII